MDTLYALFMGAGVATFAYSKLGRRAGYGNTQSILAIVVVAFVISFVVTLTVFKFILHI